jgi:hypothetical protein
MNMPEPLIDENGDVRELTSEDMKRFKPLKEVDPALYAAIQNGTFTHKGVPIGQGNEKPDAAE